MPSYRRVDMMPPKGPMCECISSRSSKTDSHAVLDTYRTACAAILSSLLLFAVSVVSLVNFVLLYSDAVIPCVILFGAALLYYTAWHTICRLSPGCAMVQAGAGLMPYDALLRAGEQGIRAALWAFWMSGARSW